MVDLELVKKIKKFNDLAPAVAKRASNVLNTMTGKKIEVKLRPKPVKSH